jgi:hypothetical protein
MSTARYPAGSSAVYSATLRNADGTAIVYDSLGVATPRISTLTLSLVDEISGTSVNSRTGNSHLNTNNVTVNSSGVLTWQIQPADTTIVNTSGEEEPSLEEHKATFVATYIDIDGDTKTLTHEHILGVRNNLALCRFEDVQLQIPGVENLDRQFIENIIDAVSARCESYCKRKFMKATRTEYHSIDKNQRNLFLKRYPIQSVTGIWEDWTGGFSEDVQPTNTDDYDAVTLSEKGIVRARYRPWNRGVGTVKVTYVGGLARNVGGLPHDLRHSVARQAAFVYTRRASLGILGESIAGTSVSLNESDLLEDVRKVWASYTRNYLP